MQDTCVCCGGYVPEGSQVCKLCERVVEKENVIEKVVPLLNFIDKALVLLIWTPILVSVMFALIIALILLGGVINE